MSLKAIGTILAGFFAVLTAISSIWLVPILKFAGFGRPVEDIGASRCIVERSLQSCEKMVLHRPAGLIYAACSDPFSRSQWTPSLTRLYKPKSPPEMDSFAAIDITVPLHSSSIKHLKLANLPTHRTGWRGLNLVGLDVVESETEAGLLWVYVINHRPPIAPLEANTYGADSSVEIFRTTVGDDTLHYVRTIEDEQHIVTPNDVIGLSDGSGFWVSNDHSARTGIRRELELFFGLEAIGIAFCDTKNGCNFAITGIPGINGISRAPKEMRNQGQDYVYAAENGGRGRVFILERQADNSLVLVDIVDTGYILDNIHVEPDGSFYVASFPKPFALIMGGCVDDPLVPCPAAVHRVSINPASLFGEKYAVKKIFENNGTIASGVTSAIWDSSRSQLWLHGLSSLGLVSCQLL